MRPAVRSIALRVLELVGMGPEAVEALEGPLRIEPIVSARHVTAWLARERLMLSYPELGREFGDRDHRTMMPAIKKVALLFEAKRAGRHVPAPYAERARLAWLAFEALPLPARLEPGLVSTSGAREIELEATG
jgi:hypothetical protein